MRLISVLFCLALCACGGGGSGGGGGGNVASVKNPSTTSKGVYSGNWIIPNTQNPLSNQFGVTDITIDSTGKISGSLTNGTSGNNGDTAVITGVIYDDGSVSFTYQYSGTTTQGTVAGTTSVTGNYLVLTGIDTISGQVTNISAWIIRSDAQSDVTNTNNYWYGYDGVDYVTNVKLSQVGNNITGTYTNAIKTNITGNVTGTINGSIVNLTFTSNGVIHTFKGLVATPPETDLLNYAGKVIIDDNGSRYLSLLTVN